MKPGRDPGVYWAEERVQNLPHPAVGEIRDRLDHIEGEIGQLKPSLTERLARLEAAAAAAPRAAPAKGPGARLLAWMGAEAPKLLAAVVLLVIGYWIKDSVDLAIKRQQLQLAYSKEMQAHLEHMAEANADRDKIERSAMLLAAYGEPAIIPLLNEARNDGLRGTAAESGLRFLALTDPDAVCRVLSRVLQNRSRLFGWQGHLRIVRSLGDSGCTGARPELERYRDALRAVAGGAPPDLFADEPKADGLQQLQQEVERALERLARS